MAKKIIAASAIVVMAFFAAIAIVVFRRARTTYVAEVARNLGVELEPRLPDASNENSGLQDFSYAMELTLTSHEYERIARNSKVPFSTRANATCIASLNFCDTGASQLHDRLGRAMRAETSLLACKIDGDVDGAHMQAYALVPQTRKLFYCDAAW